MISKLVQSLFGTFKPNIDENLKKNEVKLLVEMNFHPNHPLKYYVEAIGMEFGSFTYLSDRLIEKGFVYKTQSEKDKRVSILSLTEKGEEIALEVCKQFQDHILLKVEALDQESQDKFNLAIDLLEETYEKVKESQK